MTKLDKKSRQIIRAIEKEDGEANTTEIRRITGLENSSVRYRYRKLERRDLITTERDPEATPEGVAGVITASLTDKCREEIDKGLIVEVEQETANVEPVDNAERIEDLETTVSELEERVESLEAFEDKARAFFREQLGPIVNWFYDDDE